MQQALNFYVNQCQIPGDNPFSFLEAYQEEIQNADYQVNSLSSTFESVGLDKLTLTCGRDFQEIAGLADQMANNLSLLKQNALDTLELLRCDNIVPIYTSTFFDATCTYSIQGATWAYSCKLSGSLSICLIDDSHFIFISTCGHVVDGYDNDHVSFCLPDNR
jgi:hypothetical protein